MNRYRRHNRDRIFEFRRLRPSSTRKYEKVELVFTFVSAGEFTFWVALSIRFITICGVLCKWNKAQ